MDVIFFLIPLAIGLATAALIAFRWAVRAEQFDDLHTPAVRILFDDEELSR